MVTRIMSEILPTTLMGLVDHGSGYIRVNRTI